MWAGWACGRLRGAGGGDPTRSMSKRGWLSPPKKRSRNGAGSTVVRRPGAGRGLRLAQAVPSQTTDGCICQEGKSSAPLSPCPSKEVSSTWWFRPDRREEKAPKPQTPPCGTPAPCSPTDWLTAAAGVASHFVGSCLDFLVSMPWSVWCEMESPTSTNQRLASWATTVESRLCSLVVDPSVPPAHDGSPMIYCRCRQWLTVGDILFVFMQTGRGPTPPPPSFPPVLTPTHGWPWSRCPRRRRRRRRTGSVQPPR